MVDMEPKNCWEFKKCGREPGGPKVSELGICQAYPNHGKDCWIVTGTFCGGKAQGTFAQKYASCKDCEWFRKAKVSDIVISILTLEMGPSASPFFMKQCKTSNKEPDKITKNDLDEIANMMHASIKPILGDDTAGKVKEGILKLKS